MTPRGGSASHSNPDLHLRLISDAGRSTDRLAQFERDVAIQQAVVELLGQLLDDARDELTRRERRLEESRTAAAAAAAVLTTGRGVHAIPGPPVDDGSRWGQRQPRRPPGTRAPRP